jgi:hypothetical protein
MRGQGNDLDDQRSSFLSVAQHCATSHYIMSTTGKVLRNNYTEALCSQGNASACVSKAC